MVWWGGWGVEEEEGRGGVSVWGGEGEEWVGEVVGEAVGEEEGGGGGE